MTASSGPTAVPRLGELLDIPEIRTVVRLADAADEPGRRALADSFVLTETVQSHLAGLLTLLGNGQGGAGFVVGNYGTGKSHFLAFLAALASLAEARQRLAEAVPEMGPRLGNLDGRSLLVLRVSLLDYAGRERLEDLVFSAWSAALGLPPPVGASRTERADDLLSAAAMKGYAGVLLLLDELSEFLRSKPDGAAFTDDVRMLQLLGEIAQDRFVVVLGALQEQFEATGALSPETLNKIKDRYKLRLYLRAEHLEQIVATRLLCRRPGAEAVIARLARRVLEALPELAVARERLERMWPVHPATLAWLDELRELFSRQRGALDFVSAQLRGDPARGEPGRLAGPADELLTPDVLYDHFVPRLVEEPELRPYHESVMGWWQREGQQSLPESLRPDATRALKLLLLAAISPARRPLAPRAIMEALVLAKSRIDPAANLRYATELCAALARAGTFVRLVDDDGDAGYVVDYRANASLAVGRRLAEEERRLGPDDRRPFWRLAQSIGTGELPLDTLLLGRKLETRWQNTGRTLDARLLDLDELGPEDVNRLLGDLGSGAIDGVLLLAAAAGLAAQRRHLDEVILPRLRAAPGRLGRAVAVLLPAPLDETAAASLGKAYAYSRVAEGLRGEGGESARAALAYLAAPEAEARRQAQGALAAAYAAGEAFGAEGLLLRVADQGPLGFERLVALIAEKLCAGRYPRHLEIRPGSDQFGAEALEAALGEFVRARSPEAPLSPVARRVVQDLYIPLGVAKLPRGRRPADGRPELEVSPAKTPIVAEYLDAVRRLARLPSRPAPFDAVERELRTGPFGMCQAQFRALTLVLVHTGHVTARTGGRTRRPDEVNALSLRHLSEIGLGEVVDAELWRRVTALPFVPARFRGVPPTVPLQAELAAVLASLKSEVSEIESSLRRAVERCRGYRSLEGANLAQVLRDAEALARLARALGEGDADPRAAFEVLDAACRAEPDLGEVLGRARERAAFFAESLDSCVRLYDYLHHPSLVVPEGEEHAELAARLAGARTALAAATAAMDGSFAGRAPEAFEAFRAAWAERYLRAHEHLADDPRFLELEGLRRGEAYRLLGRLGGLPGLSAEHDQVAIDRELASARARRCLKLRPEILYQRPVCECGLRLGDALALPEPARVEERILQGLAELGGALVAGPTAERLRAAAAGLRAVGRAADADAIGKLLERQPPGRDATAAEILALARAAAAAEVLLREALRAPVEILDRDGDALLGRLAGRTMTVEALRAATETWLAAGGEVSPGSYVRIGSALLAPSDSTLRHVTELADRRFPDLAALARRPEELLVLAALARTSRDHGAPLERVASFARRGDLTDLADRGEALAALAAALLDGEAEGPALATRASDLLEPLGIEALGRALVPDDGPQALLAALAAERTLPALLCSFARRFLRGSEAASTTLGEAPLVPAAGPVAELASELLAAAAARLRLRAAARAMAAAAAGDPPGARALGDLYVQHLASVEVDAARLERLAARYDLLDPAGLRTLRAETRATLEKAERAFAALCAERYESWLADGRGGPTLLPRALATARARVKADLGAEPSAILLVDALRLDVWRALRAKLEAGPPPGVPGRAFRVLFETAAWAHRPTTTAVNLAALQGRERVTDPGCDAAAGTAGRSDADDPQLGHLVHLRSLDVRVHHAREAPDLLVEEAAADLYREVASLAAALPAKSPFLVLADHGFVEARDFDLASPHARPRYRHGGDSPFELIVPVAAVLRV